ncbi:hypothetical protein H1D32_04065 [Anaerobacillus sp. CMMVII]|uniref:hypothetical protein n=1 Tax=Anaerobacillus sp. CMMVII TaxID=2755588 RepID=UPI0021B7A939|nr:hypothetical protein [Anaerobacillus sp. CMMVII]MCT8136985.1 hypothetical protein [Anaerobacillus sp. CMMVII]
MAEYILMIIFFIPIYGLLIWIYFYPEESMLLGQRWRYKEEPEFSKLAIGYTRFASVIGIFLFTIVLVSSISENYLIRVLLVLGLLIYLIYSVLKFRKKLLK